MDVATRSGLAASRPSRAFGNWPRAVKTVKVTLETAYIITSMTHDQVTDAWLAELLQRHWSIEARVHYVRHVAYREDHCQVRSACDIPEAHRLAVTIQAWWPAVEAAVTTGYSNACVSSRSLAPLCCGGFQRTSQHRG